MKNNLEAKLVYRKSFFYIAWFCLISWIFMQIQQLGIDTNTQGARCVTSSWTEGKMYQWIYDDEPCVYTREFLIGYYFFFMLYFVFDIVRRWIVQMNPSLKFRIKEILVWLLFKWGILLRLTAVKYGKFDLGLAENSFCGTLLFFLPFVLLAIIVMKLSVKQVVLILGSMILLYLLMLYLVVF